MPVFLEFTKLSLRDFVNKDKEEVLLCPVRRIKGYHSRPFYSDIELRRKLVETP